MVYSDFLSGDADCHPGPSVPALFVFLGRGLLVLRTFGPDWYRPERNNARVSLLDWSGQVYPRAVVPTQLAQVAELTLGSFLKSVCLSQK